MLKTAQNLTFLGHLKIWVDRCQLADMKDLQSFMKFSALGFLVITFTNCLQQTQAMRHKPIYPHIIISQIQCTSINFVLTYSYYLLTAKNRKILDNLCPYTEFLVLFLQTSTFAVIFLVR